MSIASKYNPTVVWLTLASNVFKLTDATPTVPATYRVTVAVVNSNDIGAGQKAIGYYLVDYIGVPYSIIAIDTNTIDVSDDFRTGKNPTSGKNAIIYKSVFGGRGLYLAPSSFINLHPILALANSHKYDMAIIYANDPNVKKIEFTDSALPTISGYQSDQLDGFNLAEDYGEDPLVRCIITVDANTRYQLQQMPQMILVGGKLDSIFFDLAEEMTGYILISKS